MDTLLAKLSEQQSLLQKQKIALASNEDGNNQHEKGDSTASSVLLTPATDSFSNMDGNDYEDTAKLDAAEMKRLKKELDAAKNQIARQNQELEQSRVMKHTFDQAVGSAPEADLTERAISNLQSAFAANVPQRPTFSRHQNTWGLAEDARSDASNPVSVGSLNAPQHIWSNSRAGISQGQVLPSLMVPPQQHIPQRIWSGPASPISGMNEYASFQSGPGLRRANTQTNRAGVLFGQPRTNPWDMYAGDIPTNNVLNTTSNYQPIGMFQQPMQYQPRPIGTPLSPTAAEFTSDQNTGGPWNNAVSRTWNLYVSD